MKKTLFYCFVLLCAISVVINHYYYLDIEIEMEMQKARIIKTACYFQPSSGTSVQSLNEEELADPSKFDKYIFFLETSCPKNGFTALNPRQACAVESAARMNPNMTVYLLILSPYHFAKSAKNLVDRLSTYSNINIRRIFVNNYVKNTVLEKWWYSGAFETSWWPREHISDVLRYLTLWKFPGIYLDLDFVVITSLEDLKDFVSAESNDYCSNGVMRFGSSQISRTIAALCLESVRTNFNGTKWGHNGPVLITKVLSEMCGTTKTSEMTRDRCSGFIVHPPSMFYPLPPGYSYWRKYFEPDVANKTMELIRKSRAIHLWNSQSHSKAINVTEEIPYTIIARQYCPIIFNSKWQ